MRRPATRALLAVAAIGVAAPAAAARPADVRIERVVVRRVEDGVAVRSFRRTQPRHVVVRFRVVEAPARKRLRARVVVRLVQREGRRVVAWYEIRTYRIRVETGRWRWAVPVRVPKRYPLGRYRLVVRVALHPPTARWKVLTSASSQPQDVVLRRASRR